MKNFFALVFVMILASSNVHAQERSPFTNVDYGAFLGWGNFIQIEHFDYLEEGKKYFLIELNGKGYKEIIKELKDIHGRKWKCRFAEHFVETMAEIGVVIGDTVDMKVYRFDGSHEVFALNDIPATEENIEEIQFESNHCN